MMTKNSKKNNNKALEDNKKKIIDNTHIQEINYKKYFYLGGVIILIIATFLLFRVYSIETKFSHLLDEFQDFNQVKINEKEISDNGVDHANKTETFDVIEKEIPENQEEEIKAEVVDLVKNLKAEHNDIQNDDAKVSCNDYVKLVLYVVNLKNKIEKGDSFQKELVLISFLTRNNKPLIKKLSEIEKFANSGVPSINDLKDEFKAIENDLIISSWFSDDQPYLKQNFLNFISKFIFIKKVGERAIDHGGMEKIIEETNRALAENEIENAIKLLLSIEDEKSKRIANLWITEASNYLKVNKAVESLIELVTKNFNCRFKFQLDQNYQGK